MDGKERAGKDKELKVSGFNYFHFDFEKYTFCFHIFFLDRVSTCVSHL